MANKKTSSSESTKKASTTKKTNSTKTTSKKATPKTTAKKVETKAANKTTTKKVETKPVVKEEIKTVKKEPVKKQNKIISWFEDNYVIVGLAIIAILLIVNIIIVANGHKVKLSDGNEVIASVKGKKIVAEELFNDLKEKSGSDALLNIIDSYIAKKELSDDEKLEAKEEAQKNIESIKKQYEEYGYDWETVLSQYGYESEDVLLDEFTLTSEKELVAKKYIKKDITDEDIQKYYDENVFGTYSAKHILITPDTNDEMSEEEVNAAEESAKNTAKEVIDKLNNGEKWADLVKEYSKDEGSVDDEGLIENFTKGDVVDEFWDAVVNLEDGKYTSEPVKSSYGYHIILRESYEEKESLKKMKSDIIDKIIENKLSEDTNLYTDTWVTIRKKYDFKINDTIIKKAYENSTNKKSE